MSNTIGTTEAWEPMLAEFVDNHLGTLPTGAIRVWAVLFRNANADRHVCITQANVAELCGLSLRHVNRMIRGLVDAGLLLRIAQGCKGGHPSVYHLVFPTAPVGKARRAKRHTLHVCINVDCSVRCRQT